MPVSFDLKSDLAACRALLRGGSRTFFAASLLLPAKIYEPASALYAFCRLADDAVDIECALPDAAIARLRDRLDRAYQGRPADFSADRAFAATVLHFNIPRALPEALIEGFEWDAVGRRYETLSDLYDYAARVAGSVGAMMAMIMGVDSAAVTARACDLGMAMQFSNIARDVGEDARNGRLYLPLEWLREAGINPDSWLAQPVFCPALGKVIARLLAEADRLYARSETGIARLPATCRPGIFAARFLYAEIGHEVERRGCDSVSSRARVSSLRKTRLMGHSVFALSRNFTSESFTAVADEARFLIDAISYSGSKRAPTIKTEPWWSLDHRIAWLVDLFERLEMQDQFRHAQPPAERAYRPRPAARLGRLQY